MKERVKSLFGRYEFEIVICVILWLAWKCRGLFSAVGSVTDGVGSALAGLTAGMQQEGKKAQQRAAIKDIFPGATDSDLQKFEDDANALADSCGGKSVMYANTLNTNWHVAYAVAKRYSRLLYRVDTKGVVSSFGTRRLSLRLPVLYSFYKDATSGRSLQADLDTVMQFAPAAEQAFYRKYIK